MQFVMLQESNLSRFRNATCHALGMQLEVPIYKKCVHLCTFIVPSAVAALAVSLSKNCDESEEELGD